VPQIDGPQTLALPAGAEILDVVLHDGTPHLVVLANPDAPPVDRVFMVCREGVVVPDTGRWVGAAGHHGGRALHVFE